MSETTTTPKDTAVILGKERQPARIETPESALKAGFRVTAAKMLEEGVARELFYLVGRHGYVVTERTNGRQSKPFRMF